MKILRPLAIILSFTVTATFGLQSPLEAMLAPASATQSAEAADPNADARLIQSTLESKALRGKLHALGLSDQEIDSRLSRLTEAQKHQLASQIRAVNPAGEILIGILVIVVLVLLIVYLFKRI